MIWRDGEICDAEPDRGEWGGSSGVFTTVGCDLGHPLLWSRHRARLEGSMLCLEARLRPGRMPDVAAVKELLDRSCLGGWARLRVVARVDGGAWRVEACGFPVTEAGPRLAPISLRPVRWSERPPDVGHKLLQRSVWDAAGAEARRHGFDDALLLDSAGKVMETSVANVVALFGRSLVTPEAPRSCLPGVMRGWLLEHASAIGLVAAAEVLQVDRLLEADELWISNAVIGVRRVARVGDRSWRSWPAFERVRLLPVPAPGWQRHGV